MSKKGLTKKRTGLSRAYIYLVLAFLYAPIIILILFSFNASKSRGVWTGLTLDWYGKLLKDEIIISSLGTTLLCGVISAVIATVIGTMAAIGLMSVKKRWRSVVLSLSYLPMLNAEIVTGVSLMMMYTLFDMNLGFTTLILSHVTFCVPYVILTVLPKVRQFDYSQYEAAIDLGATARVAMKKVLLPDLLPGIVTGLLLSFTLSIDDFIISFLTTGNGVSNLSITIYTMAKRGINPEINALSTFVFGGILLLLVAINVIPKSKKQPTHTHK